MKVELTVEERMKAAVLHYVHGVEMQVIAIAFEVNHGRVSEACAAIKLAAEHPRDVVAVWRERPRAEVTELKREA